MRTSPASFFWLPFASISFPLFADVPLTINGATDDWSGNPPLATDPEGEGIGESDPASDLIALHARADASTLALLLRTAARPALSEVEGPDGGPSTSLRTGRLAYGIHLASGATYYNHQVLLWDEPSGLRRARYVAKAAGAPGEPADASAVEAAAGEAVEFRIPLSLLEPLPDGPVAVKAFVLDVRSGHILDAIEAAVPLPPRPDASGIILDGKGNDWAKIPFRASPKGEGGAMITGAYATHDDAGLTLALRTAKPPGAGFACGAYLACGVPRYSHQFLTWGESGRVLWRYRTHDDAAPEALPADGLRAAAGEILEWRLPWESVGGKPPFPLWIKMVIWDLKSQRTVDAFEFPYGDERGSVRGWEGASVHGAPASPSNSPTPGLSHPPTLPPSHPPTATTSTASPTSQTTDVGALLDSDWTSPPRLHIQDSLQTGDWSEYRLADGRGTTRWASTGTEGDLVRIENRLSLLDHVSVRAFLVDRYGNVRKAWLGPPGGAGTLRTVDPPSADPRPYEVRPGLPVESSIEVPAGRFPCVVVVEELIERATGQPLGTMESAYGAGVRFPFPEPDVPAGKGLVRRRDALGRITHLLVGNGSGAKSELELGVENKQ